MAVAMPDKTIETIVKNAVNMMAGKLSMQIDQFGEYLIKNTRDIRELMARVSILGQSLDSLYEELREHQDVVARVQSVSGTASVSHGASMPEPEVSVSPGSLDEDDSVSSVSTDALISEEEVLQLKRIVRERKREREGYFRRTILVRRLIRPNEENRNLSYFSLIMKNLREHKLGMLMECSKFYVCENGNVRFTYNTRREAIQMLIDAKATVRHSRSTIVFVLMVPPSSLNLKYKIQEYGRQLKSQGFVQSYETLESRESGEWRINLRVYLRGHGRFILKSSEFDNFEDVLNLTRDLIDYLAGVGMGMPDLERLEE